MSALGQKQTCALKAASDARMSKGTRVQLFLNELTENIFGTKMHDLAFLWRLGAEERQT